VNRSRRDPDRKTRPSVRSFGAPCLLVRMGSTGTSAVGIELTEMHGTLDKRDFHGSAS